ncbi:MAG: hypothetical protein K8R87_06805 [Verrucomicrobia bacterium]|nr:hypothetical protein [Verrucomicrobiota bacterium]
MNAHREGWLADEYVRFFALSARKDIASLYGFEEFLPGYELWGSWGLDALCLGRDSKLYRIPWIPLSEAGRQDAYPNIEALSSALATLHEATPAYEHFGKELHFIKPFIFGGSPDDSANIAMVDQSTHAQFCRFWNGVYARLQTTVA